TVTVIDSGTAVLSSLGFTPVDPGTPADRGDDYIEVAFDVSGTDANLAGSSLTVTVYDAAAGGTARFTSAPVSLSGGPTVITAVPLRLAAGPGFLGAVLVVPFGNQGVSARDAQDADFYGPTVVAQLWDGSGSPGGAEPLACGATLATACPADTLAPDP